MRADVAVPERAENGIDQRVQDGVGVGMAGQASIVGDLDAAQD